LQTVLWDGGYWGGDGRVTITNEMTIEDGGLGAGSEYYLVGKTIEIQEKLIFNGASITGYEGSKILIGSEATMEWQSGLIGWSVVVDGIDLTLTNLGTVEIYFGDFGAIYSGVVKIVNSGNFGMADVAELYAATSAQPELILSEGAEFWLLDDSILNINVFAIDDGDSDGDAYHFNDVIEVYAASICSLGGTLSIEFVEQTDCFPTCPDLTITAGMKWRFLTQRAGEDDVFRPCFGTFSDIVWTGLDSNLKVGVEYLSDVSDYYSDLAYVSIVICASTDAECGDTTNSNVGPTGITVPVTVETSSSSSGLTSEVVSFGTDDTGDNTEKDTGNEPNSSVLTSLIVILLSIAFI